MQTIAPFGFVTGCHPGDKFMVQATLASIRHFCPSVPICLIADGGVEVADLQQQYDLHVLDTRDLADPAMRELCYGNYYAKMAAMWVGPFEYAVWLDSDAILWGDASEQVDMSSDFCIFSCNGVSELTEVPFWLTHYQHNPDLLAKFDPAFDWRRNPYFCSGTFAFRKNVVPFDLWRKVHSWRAAEPKLFAWGEMGMLNYCIHSLCQCGEIKIALRDLQHLRSEQGTKEFVADLNESGWRFPLAVNRARVGHFCGTKPLLINWRSYSKPFTIARLEHYRRSRGELGAWLAVCREELSVLLGKILGRLQKMIRVGH